MPLSANAARSKDKATGTSAELQHRHLAFIAAVLRENRPPPEAIYLREQWEQLVKTFCYRCKATNPRFDSARFYEAAGL